MGFVGLWTTITVDSKCLVEEGARSEEWQQVETGMELNRNLKKSEIGRAGTQRLKDRGSCSS